MQSGAVPGPAGAGDVGTPKLGTIPPVVSSDVPFPATQPSVSKCI